MQLSSNDCMRNSIKLLLSLFVIQANALRVYPPLLFVDEDFQFGTELPVAICGTLHNLKIRSGDEHNTFEIVKINNTCSTLKLKRTLDADIDEETGQDYASYSLIFEADRQQASLDIQVVDVNDNAPMFKPFPSVINLSEKTPVLAEVATARVFDPDTGLGGLVEIYVQGENFSVDPTKCSKHYCTTILRVAKPLDYETQNRHSIVLVARDGARRIKRIHETRLPIFINVIDEQDMPPTFITNPDVKIRIPEGQTIGKKVFQIKAEDGDKFCAIKNQIRYDIEDNKYFDIEHDTGWLIANVPLDRETVTNIDFNITATELDEYKMKTEQYFSVEIVDSDDEIPKCDKNSYIFDIIEGQDHFERTDSIIVMDNDEKENAEFSVKLSGKYSEYFEVEPKNIRSRSSLILKVKNATGIDYEVTSKINLKLELVPKVESSVSGSCSIIINVKDQNDNPPQFRNVSYVINVVENKDPHIIASFQAQELDSDAFLPILYRLSGPDSEAFSVDNDGRISSRKRFDRELKANYHLILEAVDDSGKGLTSVLNVTVNIIDENDNFPKFQENLYSVTINEETDNSFNVKAVDSDTNEYGEVKYSLLKNDFPYIEIDEKSGKVIIHKTDAEKLNKLLFNVTVVAQDNGNPPQESAVPLLIEIKDLNDHSPIFENSFVLADVDQKSQGVIATVHAKDSDKTAPNNLVTYKLATYHPLFSINERTGDLSINEKPNGTVEFWKLSVIAEDSGSPRRTGEAKVFVQFKDREKVAFINSESEVHLLENATVGTVVFIPKLLNEPKNLSFEINEINVTWVNGPGKLSKWLEIDEITGTVTLTEQIDGDMIDRIQIVILVKNFEKRMLDKCKAIIVIDDVNDNSPTFAQKIYNAEILENSPIGKEIIVVEATDLDRTDKLSYSILACKKNTSVLYIDSEGRITVNGEIDYEKIKKITCTVVAEDLNGNAAVANLTVIIQDANDNRPIFISSSVLNVSIYETAPIGTLLNLTYPLASDSDSGLYGRITYSLLEGTELFSIDKSTSQLFLNGSLDYEKQHIHTIKVRAVDNDDKADLSNEAVAKITVNVLDVNDNAPVFVPAEMSLIKIEENESVGNTIMTLEATDKDSELYNKITYSLANDSKTFAIDVDGNLKLVEPIAGKVGNKICTTVEAKDSGEPPLSSFQKVCVMVIPTGVSKNNPLILWPENNSIHYFDENTKYDYLFTINATTGKNDEGNDLQYGIIESYSQDWKSFTINSTGTVFAKQIFDFERQKLYELRIQLCDFSDACVELTVFIAVNDLNDHCPEFKSEENEPVEDGRELVGVLTPAQDLDASSKHRNICYDIAENNRMPFFFYDKKKPELFVRESLDREQHSVYELIVTTYDCNNSCNEFGKSSVSNITVIIEVTDVNDNFPKFRERVFHAAAIQGRTEPGEVLLTVVADDPDVEENGLKYEVKSGMHRNSQIISATDVPLYMNSSTGQIFSNNHFRTDESASLNFYVTVTDGVGHEDEALVTITIISYEQQMELLFDVPSSIISEQLTTLQKFLSAATSLTAVVDTVFTKTNSTIIMAHFLDQKNSFVPMQDALRILNQAETPLQQKAKQVLLNKFGLRKAEPASFVNDDDVKFSETFGLVIYGTVSALILLIIVLIVLCCRQRKKYSRKMKTVGVVNYSTVAIARHLPHTNIHHSKNYPAPIKPIQNDEKADNNKFPQQLFNTLQSTEL